VAAAAQARAVDVTVGAAGRGTAELTFSDGSFRDTLAVASPANIAIALPGCQIEATSGFGGLRALSENTPQRGYRVELDSDPATPGILGFAAGTTISFALCAQTNSDPACEYVWVSSGLNFGFMDHVLVTDINPGQPGRAFRLAWEDETGLGDRDFNSKEISTWQKRHS